MAGRQIDHRTVAFGLGRSNRCLERGRVVVLSALRAEVALHVEDLSGNAGRARIRRADGADGLRLEEGRVRRESARGPTARAAVVECPHFSGDAVEAAVGGDELKGLVLEVAAGILLRLRMGEHQRRTRMRRVLEGAVEDQGGDDVLAHGPVRRLPARHVAVLDDGRAVRVLLDKEPEGTAGRAAADGGRVFALQDEVRNPAPLEMRIAAVEVALAGLDADAAIAELAADDDAVVVVEVQKRDAAAGALEETVLDALLGAGGVHLPPTGVDCRETGAAKRAMTEEVVALESRAAHVQAGARLVRRIEVHAHDARLADAEQTDHRDVLEAVPANDGLASASDDRKALWASPRILLQGAEQKRVGDPVGSRRKVDRASLHGRGTDGQLNRRRIVSHAVADGLCPVPGLRCLHADPVRPDIPVQGRDFRRGVQRTGERKGQESEGSFFHF